MKTVGIREAKASLSAYVARAQHERVLIMKHGKPAALVIGVEGQDLEDVLLAHDPTFWKAHSRATATACDNFIGPGSPETRRVEKEFARTSSAPLTGRHARTRRKSLFLAIETSESTVRDLGRTS